MKRFLLALVLSMLAGWAVPAGSAAARPHTGTWHRLNADQSNPAPEHERLRCREGAARWACPAWFTECADVIRVVEGVATIRPEGEQPFKFELPTASSTTRCCTSSFRTPWRVHGSPASGAP